MISSVINQKTIYFPQVVESWLLGYIRFSSGSDLDSESEEGHLIIPNMVSVKDSEPAMTYGPDNTTSHQLGKLKRAEYNLAGM